MLYWYLVPNIRSTKRISNHFNQIQFILIKRGINAKADLWVKLARELHQGSFKKNRVPSTLQIPQPNNGVGSKSHFFISHFDGMQEAHGSFQP